MDKCNSRFKQNMIRANTILDLLTHRGVQIEEVVVRVGYLPYIHVNYCKELDTLEGNLVDIDVDTKRLTVNNVNILWKK